MDPKNHVAGVIALFGIWFGRSVIEQLVMPFMVLSVGLDCYVAKVPMALSMVTSMTQA